MYDKYLIRGIPVIYENSHPIWSSNNFTDHLLTLDKLIESNPCEIQSNLIFGKFSNIEELLLLTKNFNDYHNWFVHFQNCDLDAVKTSRLIIKRPNYLAYHMEPSHSNWILMSQYYESTWKNLYVKGLILVMQLKGEIELLLESKNPCFEICGDHRIILNEGDALIFTTDLWDLSYLPSNKGKSICIVTETDWNP